MVGHLRSCFRPDGAEPGASLAISGGMAGARLTHSHERQYHYVLQSLTLWREISHEARCLLPWGAAVRQACTLLARAGRAQAGCGAGVLLCWLRVLGLGLGLRERARAAQMFKLWSLAEEDLLAEGNTYRLTNTGQGLNRVQQAPAVSRAMHAILARCQRARPRRRSRRVAGRAGALLRATADAACGVGAQQLGQWVGSAVIHLGDHNVPNALLFIDKYTQARPRPACLICPPRSGTTGRGSAGRGGSPGQRAARSIARRASGTDVAAGGAPSGRRACRCRAS